MNPPTDIVAAARTYLGRGYTHDFRVEGHEIRDLTAGVSVDPAKLQIDAAYRFEIKSGSNDASNFYAITDRAHGTKGLVIDAFDVLGEHSSSPILHHLRHHQKAVEESQAEVPTRYGLRKVSKHEFTDEPERFVLRLDFPDFPECPFGESFSMLGFDTYEQTYVWLATGILRDEALIRVPYQGAEIPDNE
jgi:hypothetical protein